MKSIKTLPILLTILSIAACKKDHPGEPTIPPVTLKIISFSPHKAAKDSVITITGQGFSANLNSNIVSINDRPATVLSATTETLTIKIPLHAGTGALHIQVGNQQAGTPTAFQYLYTVTTLTGGNLGFKDGAKDVAAFDLPAALTADVSGNVFVADAINNRVRKVTPDGQVSTWAGDGSATSKNGKGSAAAFDGLAGIAIGPTATLYVAETFGNFIRKITPAGDVATFAGDGNQGFKEGNGTNAQFNTPFGIAVDPSGNVYIADTYNNSIRKITPGADVTTLAGNGVSGYQEGTGNAARFNNPSGIAVDGGGNVYVADRNNNRIRKISPSGEVTTVAGDGTFGFKDDSGPMAKFNNPFGVAVNANGHLFVADELNNRIREISPTGVVTTIAGNAEGGLKDGVGADAKFRYPYGIAVDAAGNIYVSDAGNSAIRKLE